MTRKQTKGFKMRLFSIFIILFLCGCSERIIYKEVKIPIKCDIQMQKKPAYSDNVIQDLKNLIIYSEKIEKDLLFCIGE